MLKAEADRNTSMTNSIESIGESIPSVEPETVSLQTEQATPTVDDTIYADVDYANAYKPYRITKEYKDTTGLKLEVYNHILHSDKPLCLIGDKGVVKTCLLYTSPSPRDS